MGREWGRTFLGVYSQFGLQTAEEGIHAFPLRELWSSAAWKSTPCVFIRWIVAMMFSSVASTPCLARKALIAFWQSSFGIIFTPLDYWFMYYEFVLLAVYAAAKHLGRGGDLFFDCLLYTSPSPRDRQKSRMPSS